MHMADALLSPAVGGAFYAVSAGALCLAVRKVDKADLESSKLPLMAVSGAFVFAAQMINFAIPLTGSSGHITGGILLAALLGSYPALLSVAAVLVVQCLLFADGGLLALGANVFNMGVIPCLVVYPLLFCPIVRRGLCHRRLTLAAVLSAVVSLELGAFCVTLQTLASGVTELPFATFIALMLPIHLAIGLVEGLATAALLNFVLKVRPELLAEGLAEGEASSAKRPALGIIAVGAGLAVLVAGGVSLAASSKPDGLEWSMEHAAGTAELERSTEVHQAAQTVQQKTALLPDYELPNGEGTGAAGVVGAALTCALALGAGVAVSSIKRRSKIAQ